MNLLYNLNAFVIILGLVDIVTVYNLKIVLVIFVAGVEFDSLI